MARLANGLVPGHLRGRLAGGKLAARIVLVMAAGFLLCLSEALASERRVALVIGNGAYAHAAPLTNPANDATDIAAALKDVGFHVILGLDLDKRGFEGKVREFARSLGQADVGLVFYAGHGLQVGRTNFLVPIDATLESDRDLDFETIRLDLILSQMELGRDGKTSIVFLDACRDNPFARSLARAMGTRSSAIGRGLAQVQGGVGTFISYATEPDKVAQDGQGRNSPFTAALRRNLAVEGRNLSSLMIEVRKEVIAATKGAQVPWDHSALTGEFYFRPGKAAPGADVAALANRAKALEAELRARSDAATIARLAVLKERRRDVERRVKEARETLFERQRAQVGERDSARARQIMQEIFAAQRRLGEAQAELRTTNEEIAMLEGKAEETPVVPKGGVQHAAVGSSAKQTVRRFSGFSPSTRLGDVDIYRSAKPQGQLIDSGRAETLQACISTCRTQADCIAVAMEPGTGICELYRSVSGMAKDAAWSTGIRD